MSTRYLDPWNVRNAPYGSLTLNQPLEILLCVAISVLIPGVGQSDFLQAHVFYSIPANYAAVTYPTLSSFYNVPQSYYVPRRICRAYQARLEANGLWTLPAHGEENEAEKPKRFGEQVTEKEDPKQTFKSAFQRERVSRSSGFSSPIGLIRSGCNRSWKGRAQHSVST